MFIDRSIIECRSGKGGDGRISFRREKNVPKGGPDGGNGGRGGSVYLRASGKVNSLVNFRHSRTFIAEDGENGDIKMQYGRAAEDIYIDVPIGTVIFLEDKTFLADLSNEGDLYLICKGGRGGRGNACFKNSRNKCPKVAENGLPGEKKRIILELKLLADVGIVGFPSVGKSTFISCVTKCKAEIGDYDFTTIVPNLGVTYLPDGRSFILADMPGLIKGAHLGKGLGLMFLRHIERCRVLIHLIDFENSQNPVEDYFAIRNELEQYGMHLIDRPEVIVASKVDNLEDFEEKLAKFSEETGKEIIPISSLTDFNLEKVLYKCADLLENAKTFSVYDEDNLKDEVIFDARKEEKPFYIEKVKEGFFEIKGDTVIKTYNRYNISTDEGMMRLLAFLNKIGIDKELKRMGAVEGDTVKLQDFEFEYFE